MNLFGVFFYLFSCYANNAVCRAISGHGEDSNRPNAKASKNAIKHSRKGVHQACLSLQSNPLMTSQSCSETKNLLPYIVKHLSRPAFTTKARRRAGLTERRPFNMKFTEEEETPL
nr:MAG TPA: hypothetical protein [Siphoviridae sp. ctHdl3]